jgi:hypothetical protein
VRAVLAAAASYFGAVFALGFALGVLRTVVLLPLTGPLVAVAIELPLMLGASWWMAGRLRRRWPLAPESALAMGGIAFVLLMAAEAGISLASGRSLVQHLALYAESAHQLGLAGQLAFALFPWWRARSAGSKSQRRD